MVTRVSTLLAMRTEGTSTRPHTRCVAALLVLLLAVTANLGRILPTATAAADSTSYLSSASETTDSAHQAEHTHLQRSVAHLPRIHLPREQLLRNNSAEDPGALDDLPEDPHDADPEGGSEDSSGAGARAWRVWRNSTCPEGCTLYGTCHEELGRCDCPLNRDGPSCGSRLPRPALLQRCTSQGFATIKECLRTELSCVNDCNGRGECVRGFCHCTPGTFGSDCALSLDRSSGRPRLLAKQGYTPRAKRPWVYVYELPPNLTTWSNFRRLDRPLHLLMWQRLLGSGARTADGDEADYYFIPVRQRSVMDSDLLEEAIGYLRQHFPWWHRTGGGHRHLALHTGDWGRGEISDRLRELTENMTWLTHWGLTLERPTVFHWSAAFRPDKDVVVPVYISPGHFVKFGVIHSPLHPAIKKPPRSAAQVFFAGRVCHNERLPSPETWPHCGDDTAEMYAAAIRERLLVHHWNRTGFHVVRSEPRYGAFLAGSVFCLAPPGAGHGQRQIQALFMGCVPVTVGDHISEPFEPALSWGDWGVRVDEADIPRLHEILAGITSAELAAKQARMHCAAQHMLYSSITGAVLGEDGRYDAFETLLEMLRAKAAHPGAPQETLRDLDPDLAAFLDCRAPAGFAPGPAAVAGGAGRGAATVQLAGASTDADAVKTAVPLGPGEGRGAGSGGEAAKVAAGGAGAGGAVAREGGASGGAVDDGGEGGGGVGSAGDTGGGALKGGGAGGGNATRRAVPELCSHAARDQYRPHRACYPVLKGAGTIGVAGGAICARGHRQRLATCPRPWA